MSSKVDSETLRHVSRETEDGSPSVDNCHMNQPTTIYKGVPNVDSKLIPTVGMIFKTLDEGESFYGKYAYAAGFDFAKSTIKYQNVKDTDERVVSQRILVCYKHGKWEDKSTVKKCGTVKTDCRAMVRFKLDMSTRQYVVGKFVEEHNHEMCTPSRVHFLKTRRRIVEARQSLFKDHQAVNIHVSQTMGILRNESGHDKIGFTKRDAWNLKRDIREEVRGHDAELLLEIFKGRQKKSPEFFYKIICDAEGKLTHCFWIDLQSRLQCKNFGDVLAFDTTYNTNKYSMIFAPFSGIDNHFNTVILGSSFMKDETIESFVWLFETWIEASGRHPSTIITDQDPAMRAAIARVFPHARHRFCIWHITKKLREKLGGIKNKIETIQQITNCIWNTETDAEFCATWASIITENHLSENDWLTSIYEKRNQWIPLYLKSCFFAGMHSSQRSKRLNSFLKTYSSDKNSLMDFYARFCNEIEEQRHDALEDEHRTIDKQPKLKTAWSLEKQMSQIYTTKLFYKFQEEVVSCLMHNVFVGGEEEDGKVYLIQEVGKESKKKVVIDKETNMRKCSCRLLEFLGIPCRHVLAVLKYENNTMLPGEYILHRWTKSATVRVKNVDDGSISRSKRSELSYVANQHIDEALDGDDTFLFAMSTLREAYEEIQKMKAVRMKDKVTDEDSVAENDEISHVSSSVGKKVATSELYIRDPNLARPKGCGKRLKSTLEKQVAKGRLCNSCKQRGVNHDKRNCPLLSKTSQPASSNAEYTFIDQNSQAFSRED